MTHGLHPQTTQFTFDHLSPADVVALCRHYAFPTPTPDTPLHTIAAQRRKTAADLYHGLQNTTDVRLMIAAHGLRTAPVKLPPSAQLSPKPLPPLRNAPPRPANAPRTAAKAPRPRNPPRRVVPPATAVLTYLAPQPRKRGTATYERYAAYALGLTVAELIAAGVWRSDIRWDLQRGHVGFTDPGQVKQQETER